MEYIGLFGVSWNFKSDYNSSLLTTGVVETANIILKIRMGQGYGY
jgi:hypothetical protein